MSVCQMPGCLPACLPASHFFCLSATFVFYKAKKLALASICLIATFKIPKLVARNLLKKKKKSLLNDQWLSDGE